MLFVWTNVNGMWILNSNINPLISRLYEYDILKVNNLVK